MHRIFRNRTGAFALLFLLLITSAGAQQTLYVPNGASGIGTSSNGNVGIGTAAPSKPLVVEGSGSSNHQQALFTPDGSNGLFLVGSSQSTHYNWLIGEQYNISAALEFTPSTSLGGTSFTTPAVVIQQNGNVGIGTTSPSQKLSVNGTIRAKEVIVDTGWSDYVFASDYRLAPLSEVERHIKAEGHLPGIPSAAEVADHGVTVGEMQAKLLAKIEELTLHVIEQEKRNNTLQLEVTALKKEIAALRDAGSK